MSNSFANSSLQTPNNGNHQSANAMKNNSSSSRKAVETSQKAQEPASKGKGGSDSELEEGEIIVQQVYSHTSDSEESSPERPVSSKSRQKHSYGGYYQSRDDDKRNFKPRENPKFNSMHDQRRFPHTQNPQVDQLKTISFDQKKPPPASIPLYDTEKTQKSSSNLNNTGYKQEIQGQPNLASMPSHPQSSYPSYGVQVTQPPLGYNVAANRPPYNYGTQPNQMSGAQNTPQFNQNTSGYYSNQPYGSVSNYSYASNPPPTNQPYNSLPSYLSTSATCPTPQGYNPSLQTQSFPSYSNQQINIQPLGFKIQYGMSTNTSAPPMGPQYQQTPNPVNYQPGYGNNSVPSTQPLEFQNNRDNMKSNEYRNTENTHPGYYNNPQAPQNTSYSNQRISPPNTTSPQLLMPQGVSNFPQNPSLEQKPPQLPSYFQPNSTGYSQPQPQPPTMNQGPPRGLPQYGNLTNPSVLPPQQNQYSQQNQTAGRPVYYQNNTNMSQVSQPPTPFQPFVMQAGSSDIITFQVPQQNFSQTQQSPGNVLPSYYKPSSIPQPPTETPTTNKMPSVMVDPLMTVVIPSNSKDANARPNYSGEALQTRTSPEVVEVHRDDFKTELNAKAISLGETASSDNSRLFISELQRKNVPPPPDPSLKKAESQDKRKLAFFVDTTPIAAVVNIEENKGKKVESSKNIENEEKQYRLLGHDRWFRTQEKNLLEKLQKFLVPNDGEKDEKKKDSKEKTDINSVEKEGQDNKDKEEEIPDEFNFESRYFMYNPTQVCNRCKKPGHFEKWCTEDVVLKCMFCLGTHRLEECTQIVCFNCYGVGHRSRECTLKESVTCYRCGKRGHKNTRCGVLLSKDKEALKIEKKDYNISTKCAICNSYGHPFCKTVPVNRMKSGYLDDMYADENSLNPNEKDQLTKVQEYISLNKGNGNEMIMKLQGSESEDSSDEDDQPKKKVKKDMAITQAKA